MNRGSKCCKCYKEKQSKEDKWELRWELSWASRHCEIIPGALKADSEGGRGLGHGGFARNVQSSGLLFIPVNGDMETEE